MEVVSKASASSSGSDEVEKHLIFRAHSHICIYLFLYAHTCACTHTYYTDHIWPYLLPCLSKFKVLLQSQCHTNTVYWVSLISSLWYLPPAYHFEIGPIQYVRILQLPFVLPFVVALSACRNPRIRVLCVFGIFSVKLLHTAMWIPAVWGIFLLGTEAMSRAEA